MDLDIIILSSNKSDKEKYHMISLIFMIQMNLFTKQK